MKGQLDIDTLWAFIGRDDDGTEGIVGALTASGWAPMIGADEARIKSLEPQVQQMADATGKSVSLVRFTKREEIKQIEPNRTKKGDAVRLGGEESSIIGIK